MTTYAPVYAGPVDVATFGPYGPGRLDRVSDRPVYPFQNRITADGSSGYLAEPGRYHLYLAYVCPWAQRVAIIRDLAGLQEVVSLSYLDDARDSRGWAFRENRGPDPVNGFSFLAEAYEATEAGYPGHISVPTLWDRQTGTVVSNNYPEIPIDLGTQFGGTGLDLYPEASRAEIIAFDEEIARDFSLAAHGVGRAATQEEYEERRAAVIATLDRFDARLAGSRYLFGDDVTASDVQLFVALVRFDLLTNPRNGISERRLTDYPNLWRYARDLYRIPAFRETTDFAAFQPAGPIVHPDDGVTRINVEPHLADWGLGTE
ncbi:glutathione S-transferase C-terminal domain-containing protein [Herbidospora mongoliensis]|uniref:glutathione S-transferase C-terminal domain-containing protein n=1 Tax=Herbidospora mongoliensis TaxID=688067 RepID=UPI00082D1774|nr:glutathione S-transferase C-terminal domain-containing protein [Herbidospora mongoliensis]